MADFNEYVNNYDEILNKNIRLSGEKSIYFSYYKAKIIHSFLGNGAYRILEVGCAIGNLERCMSEYLTDSKITGIDVSKKCIEEATSKQIRNCDFILYDGKNIPFDNGIFDIVVISNTLHHIEYSERASLLAEIFRVLKQKGKIFIIEHNPLNPLTSYVVRHCDFDKDVKLIGRTSMARLVDSSGFRIMKKRYIVFFPHSLKIFRSLEKKLGFLPFGAQYYIIAEKQK